VSFANEEHIISHHIICQATAEKRLYLSVCSVYEQEGNVIVHGWNERGEVCQELTNSQALRVESSTLDTDSNHLLLAVGKYIMKTFKCLVAPTMLRYGLSCAHFFMLKYEHTYMVLCSALLDVIVNKVELLYKPLLFSATFPALSNIMLSGKQRTHI